jgi:anti-sigma-K factor RskA
MDERIEDLFPLYALGALTDEERAQVDTYVAADPAAQQRLADFVRVASAAPYDVTPVDPPARVKQALMDRVRADVRSTPVARPAASGLWRFLNALRPAMPLLAGASLAIAVLVGAWAIALNGEVARLRAETTALRNELRAQSEVIAAITSPNVQPMTIAGTEHQPGARGQLLADPQARSAVLVVAGLSPLQPDQTYQFWLIRGDKPISAGVFRVDDRGRAVLPIASDDAVGSFDAMGVSIEPEGGSEQPTGEIVMLSELS